MKTKLLITILFFTNMLYAQNNIGFEDLTVPVSGYFNGSTVYTGNGSQETITYESDIANFHVNYTDTGSFDYWSAFAYSNQTDLTTASHTNYSAYSPNGGGANNSNNYVIAYLYTDDEITFDNEVSLISIAITNSVWAYKYMDGSDGSMNDYQAGDYLKLSITSILNNGTYGNSLDFYLADFTNGNTTIIDDWTTVDLSSLGAVKGLKFKLTTNDNITPLYVCLDDIVYDTTAVITDNKFANTINLYPNPTKNNINITNIKNASLSIIDLNGKQIYSNTNCNTIEQIDLNGFEKGIYFAKIKNNNKIEVKKIILN